MRKISFLFAAFIFLAITPIAEAATVNGLDERQRAETLKLISQLEARIAELRQSGIKAVVTFHSNPTTKITSVSGSAKPLIYGQSKGTGAVSLAVFNQDKQIYGPAVIRTENGLWSHQVATALPRGENEFVLYVNNFERQRFTVPLEFPIATMQISLNGKNVLTTENVSKEEARSKCAMAYGNQSPYEIEAGDILVCQWNGETFVTVTK